MQVAICIDIIWVPSDFIRNDPIIVRELAAFLAEVPLVSRGGRPVLKDGQQLVVDRDIVCVRRLAWGF